MGHDQTDMFTDSSKKNWGFGWRARSVLAGPLLILAALGFSSCGDVTDVPAEPPEPEPPPIQCAQDEFTLRSSARGDRCVTLPKASISYIGTRGNESDQSTGITNHTIKVSFDSPIAYMHSGGWQAFVEPVLPNMFEITMSDGQDLLDIGYDYHMAVGSEDGAPYFTVKASKAYPVGDHSVLLKNFAKLADAEHVSNSDNAAAYLTAAQEEIPFTAVKMETSCTRGAEGYFEWTHDNGTYDCVTLPGVRYTFTPREGAESTQPNGDPTATIRIRFDSEVVFLGDDGDWSDITTSTLLDMVEIRLAGEGEDLVHPDGPIGPDRVSVSKTDGGTVATLEPPNGAPYPPGDYTAMVSNYAKTEDVAGIAQGNNTDAYLSSIERAISFSAVDREILCARGEAGFFRLGFADGSHECVRLPDVRYTFTPRGGRESDLPNGDPTTTIRIKFSSEVVFLNNTGDWQSITKENILDMVTFEFLSRLAPESGAPPHGTDLASVGGAVADRLSVDQMNGLTILTIAPPDGAYYPWGVGYSDGAYYPWGVGYYGLSVDNYADKDDVSKITRSNSLAEYLSRTKSTYGDNYDNFFTSHRGISCDIHNPQQTQDAKRHYTRPLKPLFVDDIGMRYNNDVIITSLDRSRRARGSGDDPDYYLARRADPNKTYVIDIALVVSEDVNINSLEAALDRHYLPHVNYIYQNSGVNVEFRADVLPFSDYRDYLLCPIHSLDGLTSTESSFVLRELTPRMQYVHGADLVYGIHTYKDNFAGSADVRLNWRWQPAHQAAYFASVGSINLTYLELISFSRMGLSIETLAHELGHNLGLWHDEANMAGYPVPVAVHPGAYGYMSATGDGRAYGTIMSYAQYHESLPFFSADETYLRSELCDDQDRYDNVLGRAFVLQARLCRMNRFV